MKTITITVKLTEEQHRLLQAEAKKYGHEKAHQRIAEVVEEEIAHVIEWSSQTCKTDTYITMETK